MSLPCSTHTSIQMSGYYSYCEPSIAVGGGDWALRTAPFEGCPPVYGAGVIPIVGSSNAVNATPK